MPWLPIAFGLGIVVYFTAEREPVWWLAAAVAATAMAGAWRLRASPMDSRLRSGAPPSRRGLRPPRSRATSSTTPSCSRRAYSVSVSGFVEAREKRERSDRIVIRVAVMEAARLAERPEHIRLTIEPALFAWAA